MINCEPKSNSTSSVSIAVIEGKNEGGYTRLEVATVTYMICIAYYYRTYLGILHQQLDL